MPRNLEETRKAKREYMARKRAETAPKPHPMRHTVAAAGHMPFEGHRTQREVREDEVTDSILRELGR